MLTDIIHSGVAKAQIRRPTHALIDLSALEYNYRTIKEHLPHDTAVLSVVKANAYGHGTIETAKRLESLGTDFFGVAICEEAIELREAGIKSPIIILSGIPKSQTEYIFRFDLTPLIFDIASAETIGMFAEKAGRKIKVHLKVDTGMGRLGVLPEQLSSFFEMLKNFRAIEIEGVASHLCESENKDNRYSLKQIDRFHKAVQIVRSCGYSPRYLHIANSGAILNLPSSLFNMVRPGLMLYGSYPSKRFKKKMALKPVMSFVTEIIHLKEVKKGLPLSYGRRFITARDSLIAVIPVGYGDGLPRSLSNKGQVIIGGKKASIVGTICMDLTIVDVTDLPHVELGDEVILIGRQESEEITAQDVAQTAGTIPYEILCGINKRVPRFYRN